MLPDYNGGGSPPTPSKDPAGVSSIELEDLLNAAEVELALEGGADESAGNHHNSYPHSSHSTSNADRGNDRNRPRSLSSGGGDVPNLLHSIDQSFSDDSTAALNALKCHEELTLDISGEHEEAQVAAGEGAGASLSLSPNGGFKSTNTRKHMDFLLRDHHASYHEQPPTTARSNNSNDDSTRLSSEGIPSEQNDDSTRLSSEGIPSVQNVDRKLPTSPSPIAAALKPKDPPLAEGQFDDAVFPDNDVGDTQAGGADGAATRLTDTVHDVHDAAVANKPSPDKYTSCSLSGVFGDKKRKREEENEKDQTSGPIVAEESTGQTIQPCQQQAKQEQSGQKVEGIRTGQPLDLLVDVSCSIGTKLELGCRCAKTRCLKLYCDCFRGTKLCTSRCQCIECLNTAEESGPDGIKTRTMQDIVARRPNAFQKRVRNPNAGCKCKNSRCLKKYCDCFRQAKHCGNLCVCRNCLNNEVAKREQAAAEAKIAATVRAMRANNAALAAQANMNHMFMGGGAYAGAMGRVDHLGYPIPAATTPMMMGSSATVAERRQVYVPPLHLYRNNAVPTVRVPPPLPTQQASFGTSDKPSVNLSSHFGHRQFHPIYPTVPGSGQVNERPTKDHTANSSLGRDGHVERFAPNNPNSYPHQLSDRRSKPFHELDSSYVDRQIALAYGTRAYGTSAESVPTASLSTVSGSGQGNELPAKDHTANSSLSHDGHGERLALHHPTNSGQASSVPVKNETDEKSASSF